MVFMDVNLADYKIQKEELRRMADFLRLARGIKKRLFPESCG